MPQPKPEWLIRVYEEKSELKNRIIKLQDFLDNGMTKILQVEEIVDLQRQLAYMKLYHDVLNERVARNG